MKNSFKNNMEDLQCQEKLANKFFSEYLQSNGYFETLDIFQHECTLPPSNITIYQSNNNPPTAFGQDVLLNVKLKIKIEF